MEWEHAREEFTHEEDTCHHGKCVPEPAARARAPVVTDKCRMSAPPITDGTGALDAVTGGCGFNGRIIMCHGFVLACQNFLFGIVEKGSVT